MASTSACALGSSVARVRSTPGARVLVVCTELCTLHFQKSQEADHLVSNALFGDGAAAVVAQSQPAANRPSLALTASHCGLEPDGCTDMAWHINNFGFEMTLSSYVPRMIQRGIGELTQRLLADLPVQLEDIHAFAIHPGGRKILESIEQALGLTPHDNRFAYEVLREYGNMSSATVLFVLQRLLSTLTAADAGAPVLSFAFGPGLTLEAMLLTVTVGKTIPAETTDATATKQSKTAVVGPTAEAVLVVR